MKLPTNNKILSNVEELNSEYWDNFYLRDHVMTPSQFCVSVCTEIEDKSTILELGSGSGRDAIFFSRNGHQVVGLDLSEQAIQICTEAVSELGFQHIDFVNGNLAQGQDVEAVTTLARSKAGDSGRVVFYSRFVMHSLDDTQEELFFSALEKCLQPGDSLYFEFRTKEDEELRKHYGGHFRRFVDSNVFVEKLRNALNCEIDYYRVGQGMAKFRDEDPFVCRIVARSR